MRRSKSIARRSKVANGPAAVGAGGGFLEDFGAAGLAQLIHLALHRLAAGADAGVDLMSVSSLKG
jgi:hypothetical protein